MYCPIGVTLLAAFVLHSGAAALAGPAASSASSEADPTRSRRLERPSSVQVQGGVVMFVPHAESGRPGAASFGIAAERVLTRRLSLEGSFARLLNDSTGLQTGLTFRLSQPFGQDDRWAVQLSAGPALTFGRALGRTVLGRGAVGIELRALSGLVASYAVVTETALTATAADADAAHRLERGDLGVGWRLTLGYAF